MALLGRGAILCGSTMSVLVECRQLVVINLDVADDTFERHLEHVGAPKGVQRGMRVDGNPETAVIVFMRRFAFARGSLVQISVNHELCLFQCTHRLVS